MNDFEQTLKVLFKAGVDFVLIGGVAASVHGSAHLTYDLDICYDRSAGNLKRLADALSLYHPRLRGVPGNLRFSFDARTLSHGMNFTLATDLGDLDLFGEVLGIGPYSAVKALSNTINLYDHPCAVLSLQGLIQSKRASGRSKDLLVLPELEALSEIQQPTGKIRTAGHRQNKRKPNKKGSGKDPKSR